MSALDVERRGFDLVGFDLVGFDLVGFDLVGFDLVGFDLVGFDLVGKTKSPASPGLVKNYFLDCAQLVQQRSLVRVLSNTRT
ncbi:hypothetical protein [Chitinimonas lacunae]|uniref:Pentapeptide repeat-containing protein n=1 Tax=Chitinimonas lacunae TaxID=1963018 RepID=A0ABV8MJX1_9NEIS